MMPFVADYPADDDAMSSERLAGQDFDGRLRRRA